MSKKTLIAQLANLVTSGDNQAYIELFEQNRKNWNTEEKFELMKDAISGNSSEIIRFLESNGIRVRDTYKTRTSLFKNMPKNETVLMTQARSLNAKQISAKTLKTLVDLDLPFDLELVKRITEAYNFDAFMVLLETGYIAGDKDLSQSVFYSPLYYISLNGKKDIFKKVVESGIIDKSTFMEPFLEGMCMAIKYDLYSKEHIEIMDYIFENELFPSNEVMDNLFDSTCVLGPFVLVYKFASYDSKRFGYYPSNGTFSSKMIPDSKGKIPLIQKYISTNNSAAVKLLIDKGIYPKDDDGLKSLIKIALDVEHNPDSSFEPRYVVFKTLCENIPNMHKFFDPELMTRMEEKLKALRDQLQGQPCFDDILNEKIKELSELIAIVKYMV